MTGNGNTRGDEQQNTPMAEEGYCTKGTQTRPLTHSQSHQAQTTTELLRVKQKQAFRQKRKQRK